MALPCAFKRILTQDLCQIWKTQEMHEQAVEGHWRNGMANNLDGSEDRFIDRGCRVFRYENKMEEVREKSYRGYRARVQGRPVAVVL